MEENKKDFLSNTEDDAFVIGKGFNLDSVNEDEIRKRNVPKRKREVLFLKI